eukprot:12933669-Prorocentrum_lima.AAC.1
MTKSFIGTTGPSATTYNRPAIQLAPLSPQRYKYGTTVTRGLSTTWATHSSYSDHKMNLRLGGRCGNCTIADGTLPNNDCT